MAKDVDIGALVKKLFPRQKWVRGVLSERLSVYHDLMSQTPENLRAKLAQVNAQTLEFALYRGRKVSVDDADIAEKYNVLLKVYYKKIGVKLPTSVKI